MDFSMAGDEYSCEILDMASLAQIVLFAYCTVYHNLEVGSRGQYGLKNVS
jgi:hypothetical protein